MITEDIIKEVYEEEYLISVAETQDIQEPTLLEDLACFEY